jgi:predicted transcriptional regulator
VRTQSASKRYETDGLQYPSLKNRITGEIMEAGVNLSKLARELRVSKSNLSMVISGNRKSCNNWEVL